MGAIDRHAVEYDHFLVITSLDLSVCVCVWCNRFNKCDSKCRSEKRDSDYTQFNSHFTTIFTTTATIKYLLTATRKKWILKVIIYKIMKISIKSTVYDLFIFNVYGLCELSRRSPFQWSVYFGFKTQRIQKFRLEIRLGTVLFHKTKKKLLTYWI